MLETVQRQHISCRGADALVSHQARSEIRRTACQMCTYKTYLRMVFNLINGTWPGCRKKSPVAVPATSVFAISAFAPLFPATVLWTSTPIEAEAASL